VLSWGKLKSRDLEFEPNEAFERLKQFAKAIIAVSKEEVIEPKKPAPPQGGRGAS